MDEYQAQQMIQLLEEISATLRKMDEKLDWIDTNTGRIP